MQSDSICFRVQVAVSVLVQCMRNQLTQLSELKSVELVVTDCCTSERSSELNQI